MPNIPLFSILMPCYNAAATVAQALQSIQAQSCTDWELLAVDDGSTDATLDILRRFAGADSRIQVLARPHRGIVSSLQEASEYARGVYLARMDADDVAYSMRLERQQALLESYPDLAMCGVQVCNTGNYVGPGRKRYEAWLNQLITPEAIHREIFIECPIAHPAFAMRRADFEAVGGYQDRGWAEDYDLVLRFWEAGKKLANVPEILLEWRNAPERLSMVDARYDLAQFRALKRHYLERSYLKEHPTFYQWGAGEVGKKWLREWGTALRPRAVVDINPRKIGKTIHGIPVIAAEALPQPAACFVLVLVGAPDARTEIRRWFNARGYRECEHYLFLA